MIFVTVGSEKFPFDRLLKAISDAKMAGKIAEEVIVQSGTSVFSSLALKQQKFFSFDEMSGFIQRADIVVAHAGIGTTLLCLSLGKVPILFPRQFAFGEHLDDHQMDFAKKIESVGKVIVAYDDQQLLQAITQYKTLLQDLKAVKTSKNRPDLINALTASVK